MKTVIMISCFKEAEKNPAFLSKQVAFSQDILNTVKSIPYAETGELVVGRSYTVNDLVEQMIINSDNSAAYTLLSILNQRTLNDIYDDLGLENPLNNSDYTISAKEYAFFFRVLFNATYLSRDMSEKALYLLSRTNFKEGLVAGIDSNVPIAHKYGEAVLDPETFELHDCGLVYYPTDKYLICVMTRGKDVSNLKGLIQDISRSVFENIKNEK